MSFTEGSYGPDKDLFEALLDIIIEKITHIKYQQDTVSVKRLY